MPAMPKRPLSEPGTVAVPTLQRATKRRRLACGSSSDGASSWEPEALASCLKRAKAARQANHASPADQSSETEAISAHRPAQRQDLWRKKVTVS